MNIVITMAGLGLRFREAGYSVPKYQIEVRGKTLFEWSMSSLENFFGEPFIFIVRKADNATNFIKESCAAMGIVGKIIELDKVTRGQAETTMFASKLWNADEPLLIYNIDTYVEPGQLRSELIRGEGFIPCFTAEGTHWSFVKLDADGKAVEVREKERISNHCSIGAYYFKSTRLYSELYKSFYSDDSVRAEQYIAPIYNLLIKRGAAVYIQDISTEFVHVLGTPAEVKIFARGGGENV